MHGPYTEIVPQQHPGKPHCPTKMFQGSNRRLLKLGLCQRVCKTFVRASSVAQQQFASLDAVSRARQGTNMQFEFGE